MNIKYKKLNKLHVEAISKNELVLINMFNSLLPKIDSSIEDEEFDIKIIDYIKERAKIASNFLKKNDTKSSDQEIYCISLLSYLFLNNNYKPIINKNKVVISTN